MNGIHTVLYKSDEKPQLSEADFVETLHEPHFKFKIINSIRNGVMAISYYNGYPFKEWQNNGTQIILEGIIYNISEQEIQIKLNEISSCFEKNQEYKDLVRQFVESADGDYIVQILHNSDGRLLIFNDYLGRLPLYYYWDENVCVFSREIKVILRFIPKIDFNKSGLVEFLMFEFQIGNKTIFKDIFRLDPSKMIVLDTRGKTILSEIFASSNFNFILKDSFKTKKDSIAFLKRSFLKSVENRIKVLEQNGYHIISDLSGGYDSRTVMAGLNKFHKNVSYLTLDYGQDESVYAKDIFDKLGANGNYSNQKLDNSFNFEDIGPLVYKTDGLVDCFTTSLCYKNEQFLKKQISGIVGRFAGFAGEFIRHPFKLFYNSLLYGIDKGFYNNLPLVSVCAIFNMDPTEYRAEFEKKINSFPEQTPHDQLKRLYYDYYNHYVGAGGEERHRIHFWTINPMWSLDFMLTIFNRIPLSWVGYKYYIQFMNMLDPRLLKSPIFNSPIDIGSNLSVALNEANAKWLLLKSKLIFTIKTKTPVIFKCYEFLRYRRKTYPKIDEYFIEKINDYHNNLNYVKNVFDLTFFKENLISDIESKRLLTLLIYLREIEKRFADKILNGHSL